MDESIGWPYKARAICTTLQEVTVKQRILVMTDMAFQMPANPEEVDEKWLDAHHTEYDVMTALESLGHDTRVLGGVTDLQDVKETLAEYKPDIVFNLLEQVFGQNYYVPYLLGYLELLDQPFTGCHTDGLFFAYNKPLMKKILAYHRIPVPPFKVFPRGTKARKPRSLRYPLFVKSTSEHGSEGISQASVVTNDEKLRERVEFIHTRLKTDAMAEEYIDGREIYVGVIGNNRLETLPPWEVHFGDLRESSLAIATSKVKWDHQYREKMGVTNGPAAALPPGYDQWISRLSKRIYQVLGFCGYARLDFRLTEDGRIYLIEPNPNPAIGYGEDFAESAEAVGIGYNDLIQRIINLGFRNLAARRAA
jgi:D-alanine-D-alanine ligase